MCTLFHILNRNSTISSRSRIEPNRSLFQILICPGTAKIKFVMFDFFSSNTRFFRKLSNFYSIHSMNKYLNGHLRSILSGSLILLVQKLRYTLCKLKMWVTLISSLVQRGYNSVNTANICNDVMMPIVVNLTDWFSNLHKLARIKNYSTDRMENPN